jgi:excinuclease ABC subunit C
LTQFYADASEVPNEILLPNDIEQAKIIERWLRDKRGGKKMEVTVPQRGDKRDLIGMAQKNATEALRMMRVQYEADTTKHEEALAELQSELNLPRIPNRIECFDISTTQGTSIVASRVVFTQGTPHKGEYRRFNIRTVAHEGPDDFQSMREALTRRFARWKDAVENPLPVDPDGQERDETWKKLPDLLLIDGGKGQLGIAVEVLAAFGLTERVPVAGLAKQFEEIFLPGRSDSILLNRRSPALYLVQRVRDEAHRFAITSHRARRDKASMASKLEAIPGIGPKKKKALLKHFGNSIGAIKKASVEELCEVPGINRTLAETIHMSLE